MFSTLGKRRLNSLTGGRQQRAEGGRQQGVGNRGSARGVGNRGLKQCVLNSPNRPVSKRNTERSLGATVICF